MYNLCSERTYDSSLFGGDGVVHRFMIDDHNVPSLSEMVRFSKDVGEWLAADKENVIVVHCKVRNAFPASVLEYVRGLRCAKRILRSLITFGQRCNCRDLALLNPRLERLSFKERLRSLSFHKTCLPARIILLDLPGCLICMN